MVTEDLLTGDGNAAIVMGGRSLHDLAVKDYDPRAFPPFALTVDLVVFTLRDEALCVLLTQRDSAPFRARWSLPGGFVGEKETLLASAQRTLSAKTAIDLGSSHLEQMGTYGAPRRDPRMRVVSVAYLAFVHDLDEPRPGPRERAAAWVPIEDAQRRTLAFDHAQLLQDGLERTRAKLEYTTVATRFCPEVFTIRQLRAVYDNVWNTQLDAGNFARKVSAIPGFIEATGEELAAPRGRPAKAYRAGDTWFVHPPLQRPAKDTA